MQMQFPGQPYDTMSTTDTSAVSALVPTAATRTGRACPADYWQDVENTGVITISFQIHDQYGPSFRSAVEDFSNLLASRLEQPHAFAREQSLTNAVSAFGALRAATTRAVQKTDKFYA